ncbi:MAG TPA: tetratricopeptide repeat protein, partial [Steroidobacteraceae bacterium]|nr:tetratricopeptide repeat protein [Steroidobacteraceae bacterium]
SLEDLRKRLPETMPLSGLSICAVGDQVVVRDGNSQYQVDSGQYVLGLDVTVEDGVLRVVEKEFGPKPDEGADPPRTAEDWFDDALDFEENGDLGAAIDAYRQTVALDGQNVAAWINWGRLLHERGNKREAEAVYRRAIEQCGADSVLMFNLGVLLEDLGRTHAALEAYQAAVGEDPAFADGHYNLARLYESLGQPQHAIRHLGQYRRLLNSETR